MFLDREGRAQKEHVCMEKGHATVNEKAIKIRKKATCCISPSIKETMHPTVALNHHCCFKNQPTTLIFSPT